jgi:dolichol-phosphate mannosyltransferase
MKLVAVIAAYNERDNVEELTRRLLASLSSSKDLSGEVLYVVEGDDGTREVIERLQSEFPGIRILYQREATGLADAFRRGFAALPADCDFVLTMDADLNHRPEEIPRLLQIILASGADIVVGSRFVPGARIEGVPIWKRMLSGLGNLGMGIAFDRKVRDKTSGFRIYRAGALRSLRFESSGFAFLPEILLRASAMGMTTVEAPIHFVYRVHGGSKMRLWGTAKSYMDLARRRIAGDLTPR